MYDLVGGGFHRYSVDERWLVPHFEKMLYDNALLAVATCTASACSARSATARSPSETVDYMLRELALEGGGFASAQDADTDGVEGLTFTWAPGEGAPDELLQPFEDGRFVLRGELDAETRARALRAARAAAEAGARRQGDRVLERPRAGRARRVRPLARPRRLGRRRSRLAEFLLGPLSTADGRLHRTWRDGVAKGTGYLDDYANVANGLYELHVATGELRWLEESHRLARLAVELFADDEHGGFFQTPRRRRAARRAEEGLRRPPGAERQLDARLRAAAPRPDLRRRRARGARGVGVLRLIARPMVRVPSAFGWALVALDLHLAPRREIAIVGAARLAESRAPPSPAGTRHAVVAFGPADGRAAARGKGARRRPAAVYVCERFACRAPVTDPAAYAPGRAR